MANARISQKSLKEPDEFISMSTRLLKLAVLHKKLILIGAGTIFGILVLLSMVGYFLNRAENQGSLALTRLNDQYDKAARKDGAQKAFELVQSDLQTIINDYSGKTSGKLAVLTFADYSYRAGKFDSAEAMYSKAVDEFREFPIMKTLAAFGLGYTYEEQKAYDKAVRMFEKLTEDPDQLMKDEALLALGRLYGMMQQKEQQTKVLNQLIEKYPDSIYKALAVTALNG